MGAYKLQELVIHDNGTTEWVTLASYSTQEAAMAEMDHDSANALVKVKLRVLRPDGTECASFNPPVVS